LNDVEILFGAVFQVVDLEQIDWFIFFIHIALIMDALLSVNRP
jgi:hypothetical protein